MELKPLLEALADGEIHSGEQLASQLKVTRAAVWKQIQQLMAMGVNVEKIHAKGYRLNTALALLDQDKIASQLGNLLPITRIAIPFSTPSTNALAFTLLNDDGAMRSAHIVLAEHQTAGRGRRGKVWQSPVAGNIYLTVAWRYPAGIHVLAGLSVAIGVVIAETLNQLLKTDQFAVKWPNDIWWRDHKVAGILIEVQGDATSECACVIGVGLNVAPKSQWVDQLTGVRWQTLADIACETNTELPDRNTVAAQLIKAIVNVCDHYDSLGIAAYLERFNALDALAGREVIVDGPAGIQLAVAQGVDKTGLLVVDVDGAKQSLSAADVSLRIQ